MLKKSISLVCLVFFISFSHGAIFCNPEVTRNLINTSISSMDNAEKAEFKKFVQVFKNIIEKLDHDNELKIEANFLMHCRILYQQSTVSELTRFKKKVAPHYKLFCENEIYNAVIPMIFRLIKSKNELHRVFTNVFFQEFYNELIWIHWIAIIKMDAAIEKNLIPSIQEVQKSKEIAVAFLDEVIKVLDQNEA